MPFTTLVPPGVVTVTLLSSGPVSASEVAVIVVSLTTVKDAGWSPKSTEDVPRKYEPVWDMSLEPERCGVFG